MADRKVRYETVYVDKYKRESGRDSDRAGSSSNREGSYREASEIPRSESRRPDGPRRSSTTTTTHSVGSSRHGTRDRPRRESESLNARPRLDPEYDRTDSIPIQDNVPKRYHDRGGYGSPRDHETYDTSEARDILEASSSRRPSRSNHSPPTRDWDPGFPPEQLSGTLSRLTVHEVVGSPQYPLASSLQDLPRVDHDDRNHQLPSPSKASYDIAVGSFQDMGQNAIRESPPDPSTEGVQKHVIRGTRGETEKLDRSYAKRTTDYKKFFRPGRVFSTLWTESYDDSMQSENNQFMSLVTYEVKYRQKVISKIRRFVVVRQGERNCTCLPVTTYDGRGYKKKGINLDEHGLIYSSSKPPPSIDGINKQHLKVILSKNADRLNNPSYINYGRVYNVETNVKVKDVGDLEAESRRLLRSYYKEVHFKDFQDDDYNAPGPPMNPQQRAVEVREAGAVFDNSSSQPQSNSHGTYDRSSGSYNQYTGWNNSGAGFGSASHDPYPTQPMFSQPLSGLPATVPAYQYAAVSPINMGYPQSGYQRQDDRYVQAQTSASGMGPSHLSNPRDSSQMYPIHNTDTQWSHAQPTQPLYTSSVAPVVSSTLYHRHDERYLSERQPTGDARFDTADSAPNRTHYFNEPPVDDRSGWQDTSFSPQLSRHDDTNEDEPITLPSLQEAQALQELRRPRRESDARTFSGRDRERERDRHRDFDPGPERSRWS